MNVNRESRCLVLKTFMENIRRERNRSANNYILHNHKTPCHRIILNRDLLVKINVLSLLHPLHSPDISLADGNTMLQYEKNAERSPLFHDPEWIQKCLRFTWNNLQVKIQKWQERWDRCITPQSDYFEGDGCKTQVLKGLFLRNN